MAVSAKFCTQIALRLVLRNEKSISLQSILLHFDHCNIKLGPKEAFWRIWWKESTCFSTNLTFEHHNIKLSPGEALWTFSVCLKSLFFIFDVKGPVCYKSRTSIYETPIYVRNQDPWTTIIINYWTNHFQKET